MSSAKANRGHGVVDLDASRGRETPRLLASASGFRKEEQARTRGNYTHDEAEAIGRLLFLAGDELPLSSLLYLSDSDDELDSELELESESD